MTNDEKIIAILEMVHHENCFIFESVTRMLTANNKGVVDGVIELIDRWDAEIKAIMENKEDCELVRSVKEATDEELQRILKGDACIDCEFFSDSEYYADNTVTACAVSWGSCTKCQRNITSTSPHTEVPSWCPLKGDEE